MTINTLTRNVPKMKRKKRNEKKKKKYFVKKPLDGNYNDYDRRGHRIQECKKRKNNNAQKAVDEEDEFIPKKMKYFLLMI